MTPAHAYRYNGFLWRFVATWRTGDLVLRRVSQPDGLAGLKEITVLAPRSACEAVAQV